MGKDIKKVVIVGGVAGGATTAARLRRLNENIEIIMFEKGEHISFANCGLPYYIGGTIQNKSSLLLQTPQSFNARFNVDVRVNSLVTKIDLSSKSVTVKDLKTGKEYKESYDKLVLSPGAEPIIPSIDGINSKGVFTLRNVADTFKIKEYINNNKIESAVVVGGGFIGVEMAENLADLNIKTTIVEMQNQIMPPIDIDVIASVQNYIRNKSIDLKLNSKLEKINELPQGVELTINGQKLKTDLVILAIGIKPDSLIAKDAGLLLNEKGYIKVDKYLMTSDKDVYACGDAIEVTNKITLKKTTLALAVPANKQGRIIADNINGLQTVYNGVMGSSILKIFDKTLASTGINEKTAKQNNIDYDKVFTYSMSNASYYPTGEMMLIKTLFDKNSGKILGAQIFGGVGVDKRADVFATAINFNASYKDLNDLELCYAPPYSSAKDPVNMAGYVIDNIMSKRINNANWTDLENIKNNKDAILLDVRTPQEYINSNAKEEGFINIAVDSLRDNLNMLDKTKKIYVTCRVGLRGYIACNILRQNGFNCYNFTGGYLLYESLYYNKLATN